MSTLADQRCWHHPAREAVVRCPQCRRFYCRECVTEHLGRMICGECFASLTQPGAASGRSHSILWMTFGLGGLLIAWLIFYYLGVFLARIPSDFHSGGA